MWQAVGKDFDVDRFTPFEPAEVLYEFEGPRVFTLVDTDGELNLGYWSDSDREHDRYLIVPTTVEAVESLRKGRISVFDALDQSRCWALDVRLDRTISRCVRTDFASVPRDAIPAIGTMLLPTMNPASASPLPRSGFSQDGHSTSVAGPSRENSLFEPSVVNFEGRIRELDWDRLSFDLREIGGGTPAQTFFFDESIFSDVIKISQEQVRVRVAGIMFPGKTIAYASNLLRL